MEEILVIINLGTDDEDIKYCVEAFKKFKTIRGKKNIIKAKVERILWHDVPIIMDYELIEVLK